MFGGCDGEGEMDGVETLYNVLTNDNARATRFFFFQTTWKLGHETEINCMLTISNFQT